SDVAVLRAASARASTCAAENPSRYPWARASLRAASWASRLNVLGFSAAVPVLKSTSNKYFARAVMCSLHRWRAQPQPLRARLGEVFLTSWTPQKHSSSSPRFLEIMISPLAARSFARLTSSACAASTSRKADRAARLHLVDQHLGGPRRHVLEKEL